MEFKPRQYYWTVALIIHFKLITQIKMKPSVHSKPAHKHVLPLVAIGNQQETRVEEEL